MPGSTTMAENNDAARDGATPRWRWLDALLTLAALAAVAWFFAWTVASENGFQSGGDADLFNLLVRGYQKGHLYLDRAPPPQMLALADPYDPVRNAAYRLPDATYFQGHYYLYFGAAPLVLVLLPYAILTGHELPTGAAVFGFCLLGFLTASVLWLAIRRRYFPTSAVWSGAAGVLVLGLGTQVLALARRPGMYELPIAAGYAFTMLALAAVHAALHGRRPVRALGAAGLCLGLAAASRPPSVFGAVLLLPPLWCAWRERKSTGAWWWRGLLAAAAGLGLCLAAMLAHNQARFGRALEFGQNYQLTSSREMHNRHFGLDYVPHNLAVYYFCPVRWTWEFPFVSASTPLSSIADHAGSEEMTGLLVALPFLWLALAVPLAWRRRVDDERRRLQAMVGAVAGLYLGVGLFLLAFFSTTERYVAEFAPALGLLAVCGWLGVERWAQQARWQAVVLPPVLAATMATVAIGVLVSFDYHGRTMSRDAPALWARLERASHVALSRFALWTGQISGPRVLKVRFTPQPLGAVETFWQSADPRAGERILVEHVGPREVRFGYARGDTAVRWGRRLTWERDHWHTVELQLPSLYGPPGGGWRGLRQAEEFRERSSVAVWFSGGRALGEIVAPVAPGFAPGGAIGADFSGEAHAAGRRVFRPDELPAADGLGEPRGGTLRLDVVLPSALAPEGEPLFATGALYGSDLVFVRDAGAGEVTFVFEHFGAPMLASRPVHLAPWRRHIVEIDLPSCAADATFSHAATGDAIVCVDGVEVLRGRTDCFGFAAGNECAGRNPFGTTCAREFRGWLLDARWSGGAAQR